jgi:site-specific DNA recombinase
MEPVAIYTRLSSNRRSGPGVAIGRQESDCRELAERRRYKVVQVFPEDDTSAYSGKPRPQYRKLLELMKTGTVRVVLAYHTDRLHRSPIELEAFIAICEAHDVRVETVLAGPIDLSTPTGRMGARVYSAVAKFETEHMIERITSQKREAAKAGKFAGGGRPYGYEKDGLTIREAEAEVIRESARRIIAGESQMSIVRWLNETGRLTGTGKRWMIGNFQRTMVKKRYIGVREHVPEHGGPTQEYPAQWPPILTVADHELILARFKESAQPWNHGPIEGRSYLLSGIAFCGACGSAMYGQARKIGDKKVRRYRCRPYDNHGVKVGCGGVFRDANALEAFVSEAVLTRFDSPQVAAALAQRDHQDEAKSLADELLRLRIRRKDIAVKLALATGGEEQDLSVMLETVRDAIEQTQTKLNSLQANKAAILPRGPLREAWDMGNLYWKRDIIRLIVSRILVHPANGRRPLWRNYRLDISLIDIRWTA